LVSTKVGEAYLSVVFGAIATLAYLVLQLNSVPTVLSNSAVENLFNELFSLFGIVGVGNRGRPILYYRSIERVRLRRSGLQVGNGDHVMNFLRSGDI